MQIFNEIKARGVEDLLFIDKDRVARLEEGARSIFKDVVVQRCIVHLIRNSVKYISSKDYTANRSVKENLRSREFKGSRGRLFICG